jgi:hypothetical protein
MSIHRGKTDVVAESGNDPNCDIVRVPCHKLADLCL